jgi:hypothetical protein
MRVHVSDIHEIALNLLAAILGGVIFALWKRVRIRFLFRATRALWQPLLTKPFHVVIAEFLSDDVKNFEMTGLTGLGEVHAIVDMISRFSDAQLPTGLSLSTPSHLSPAMLSDNLIILGGPDVNKAAFSVKNARISSVAIERDAKERNIVVDQQTGITYEPSRTPARVSGKNLDVVWDYGIIIRAKIHSIPSARSL